MTTKVVTASHSNHIFDLALTNAWDVTLAHAAIGMVIENAPVGVQSDLYVILRQDGVGSRVANWPPTVTWLTSAPQPTTPILVHLITLDGANWYEAPTQDIETASEVTAQIAAAQAAAEAASVPLAGGEEMTGVFMPVQATTVDAPAYVLGGVYFDTTLNKLRIGGATAWETVTSA